MPFELQKKMGCGTIIFNGENTSKLTVSKVGKIKKVSINEKYVKKINF